MTSHWDPVEQPKMEPPYIWNYQKESLSVLLLKTAEKSYYSRKGPVDFLYTTGISSIFGNTHVQPSRHNALLKYYSEDVEKLERRELKIIRP